MIRHTNEGNTQNPEFPVMGGRLSAPPEPSPVYALTGRLHTAPDLAKAIGISLLFHLLGIALLPLLASTLMVKRPCPMIVDLTVSSCSPSAASQKEDRNPPVEVMRKVSPPAPTRKQPPENAPLPVRVAERLPAPSPTSSETTTTENKPSAGSGSEKGAMATGVTEGSVAGGAPRPSAVAGRGETPSTETSKQRYLKEHFMYIRELVARQLIYPVLARKMGWGGKAVVTFTVMEDGNVGNVRLVESSGVPLLDRSALETIRRAAPFPRPPVRAEIVLPVLFRLL